MEGWTLGKASRCSSCSIRGGAASKEGDGLMRASRMTASLISGGGLRSSLSSTTTRSYLSISKARRTTLLARHHNFTSFFLRRHLTRGTSGISLTRSRARAWVASWVRALVRVEAGCRCLVRSSSGFSMEPMTFNSHRISQSSHSWERVSCRYRHSVTLTKLMGGDLHYVLVICRISGWQWATSTLTLIINLTNSLGWPTAEWSQIINRRRWKSIFCLVFMRSLSSMRKRSDSTLSQ